MKRRAFIKGAVSAAVAASLPGGDGVELNSIAHPTWNVIDPPPPAFLPFVTDNDTGIFSTSGDKLELVSGGVRMAEALVKSLNETREMVGLNVFHRGGSTDETEGDV